MTQGLMMIREAVVRYRGSRRGIPESIRNPEDVARFVRRLVGTDSREHFILLLLDGRHRAIAYQVNSIGTATASLVHPREVFQAAVHVGAVAFVIAHNHPSGNPQPSREDLDLTERLSRAGELLGIRLLDSVVVAEADFTSIRESDPDRINTTPVSQ